MHRSFRSPHKAPLYGYWIILQGEAKNYRVPERGTADHFDQLVDLVAAQAYNAGIKIPGSPRDFTAQQICLRDPGFCKKGTSGGLQQTTVSGGVPAQRGGKPARGCSTCGGRKTK